LAAKAAGGLHLPRAVEVTLPKSIARWRRFPISSRVRWNPETLVVFTCDLTTIATRDEMIGWRGESLDSETGTG
jgi:hypothetical protein